jgi:hypothetical protein
LKALTSKVGGFAPDMKASVLVTQLKDEYGLGRGQLGNLQSDRLGRHADGENASPTATRTAQPYAGRRIIID